MTSDELAPPLCVAESLAHMLLFLGHLEEASANNKAIQGTSTYNSTAATLIHFLSVHFVSFLCWKLYMLGQVIKLMENMLRMYLHV